MGITKLATSGISSWPLKSVNEWVNRIIGKCEERKKWKRSSENYAAGTKSDPWAKTSKTGVQRQICFDLFSEKKTFLTNARIGWWVVLWAGGRLGITAVKTDARYVKFGATHNVGCRGRTTAPHFIALNAEKWKVDSEHGRRCQWGGRPQRVTLSSSI